MMRRLFVPRCRPPAAGRAAHLMSGRQEAVTGGQGYGDGFSTCAKPPCRRPVTAKRDPANAPPAFEHSR